MSEMASRISQTRSLLPTLEASLKSFQQSTSTPFKIIRSINPPSTITSPSPNAPPIKSSEPVLGAGPRTLFILDSSYNPPSRAHLAMAITAIRTSTEPAPKRLLLLFSTSNADKAPQPASFVQRLSMMLLFAQDLHKSLYQEPAQPSYSQPSTTPSGDSGDSREREREEEEKVAIDIGLTKEPYYTDKSLAITNATPPPYPTAPTHIHLLGYDTLTRLLAPKYYTSHKPPLSALSPYFTPGHKLLVPLRPETPSNTNTNTNTNTTTSGAEDTESEQRNYINKLRKGYLEKEGFNKSWSSQISILQGADIKMAAGISSTLIRDAVKAGQWEEVERMCMEGVAAWIREEGLYQG